MAEGGEAVLRVRPQRVLGLLVAVTVVLLLLGLASVLIRTVLGTTVRDTVWFFDLSGDSTVPTWFASVTLLIAAASFALLARTDRHGQRRQARGWAGLAVIFTVMSIDEVARIHEWAGPDLGTDGLLLYTWVVIGAPVVAAIGLVYLPFLRRLPADTRRSMVLAGAVYVGGALGVEVLNGAVETSVGADTLQYGLLTLVEEAMELTGVLILLHGLWRHLRREGAILRIDVGERQVGTA